MLASQLSKVFRHLQLPLLVLGAALRFLVKCVYSQYLHSFPVSWGHVHFMDILSFITLEFWRIPHFHILNRLFFLKLAICPNGTDYLVLQIHVFFWQNYFLSQGHCISFNIFLEPGNDPTERTLSKSTTNSLVDISYNAPFLWLLGEQKERFYFISLKKKSCLYRQRI